MKKLAISLFTLIPLFGFEQLDNSAFVKEVDKHIGKPYVWGGTNLQKGVDCSGFVKKIYSNFGYKIPRTAKMQTVNTKNCPTITELEKCGIGDTLYFKNRKGHIHHVAIITGYEHDGRPIITHAKGKKYGVVKERMSDKYVSEFIAAKRFYTCTSPLAGAPTPEEIAENILFYSNKHSIDFEILYTIASIESSFSPLVITIETDNSTAKRLNLLKELGLKIVSSGITYHSKKTIVNIYPPTIDIAQFIVTSLKQENYTFDLGLMQINSVNFSEEEAKDLFYPKNNIEKSTEILSTCMRQFKTFRNKIECYNRGAGNLRKALKKGLTNYPYYERYKKHFSLYFGSKGERK